jgi:hypothetical protein
MDGHLKLANAQTFLHHLSKNDEFAWEIEHGFQRRQDLIREAHVMMTMRTSLILAFTLCLHTARADDLDQLADPTISGEERGQVYARLTEVPFPPIAARLLTAIYAHPVRA